MKVIITGGCGFLGIQLAKNLTKRGHLISASGAVQNITEIILFDQTIADSLADGLDDRTQMVQGDVANPQHIAKLFAGEDVSVFHLASVVSAEAEKNYDLAMNVNINGLINVLNVCRRQPVKPKVVFASSLAVYGGPLPVETTDSTRQTPVTTYGMSKVFGELLINDMTRKSFIDGRIARLPTVIIRPGKPNNAASSFISGMFREPLMGKSTTIPVDGQMKLAVMGYRACIQGLIDLHDAEDSHFFTDDRSVTLPSLSRRVNDMLLTLKSVAEKNKIKLGHIDYQHDVDVERIIASWPGKMSSTRAINMGLEKDTGLEAIIEGFISDFL